YTSRRVRAAGVRLHLGPARPPSIARSPHRGRKIPRGGSEFQGRKKRKGAARSARTTLSGLLVGSDPSVRNGVADDEIEGIHLLAVHLHLVVQMRSADQPGGAHLGDHLSSLHPLTGAHQDAGSVSEASAITEAVIDLHGVAVPAGQRV